MSNAQKKILLIEDDPIISSVYAQRLSNLGYQTEVYARGDGALEKIQQTRPDLLLLDLMLPGRDGEEILEEVKNDDRLKDIRVVVLSNVMDQRRKESVLAKGAEAYLVKAETDLDEVVKTVQDALAD